MVSRAIRILLSAFFAGIFIFSPLKAINASDSLGMDPGYYFGWIEDIYPFTFELHEDSGGLSGQVLFPLSGDSLTLEADRIGDMMLLTEFDHTLMQVGYFLAERQEKIWLGNWQNQDGSIFFQVHFNGPHPYPGRAEISRSERKWGEKYTISGPEFNGELLVLQQAGFSVNGYFKSGDSIEYILLRGDCTDPPHCRQVLMTGRYKEEDVFVDLTVDDQFPIAVFSNRLEVAELQKNRSFSSNSVFSFNQYFVMDAVLPDLHPLLIAALEEKVAYWSAIAKNEYGEIINLSNLNLLDRFRNRNYIWTQITYLGEDFISGFMEWIQDDTTREMNSFLLDLRRGVELFWDYEVLKSKHSDSINSENSECKIDRNGVLVLLPDGLKWIGRFDILEGRKKCMLNKEVSQDALSRGLRKMINFKN